MKSPIFLSILLIMIAACDTQTQGQGQADTNVDPMFEAEREALKKAQEVEQMVKDAAEQQREFINSQEQ